MIMLASIQRLRFSPPLGLLSAALLTCCWSFFLSAQVHQQDSQSQEPEIETIEMPMLERATNCWKFLGSPNFGELQEQNNETSIQFLVRSTDENDGLAENLLAELAIQTIKRKYYEKAKEIQENSASHWQQDLASQIMQRNAYYPSNQAWAAHNRFVIASQGVIDGLEWIDDLHQHCPNLGGEETQEELRQITEELNQWREPFAELIPQLREIVDLADENLDRSKAPREVGINRLSESEQHILSCLNRLSLFKSHPQYDWSEGRYGVQSRYIGSKIEREAQNTHELPFQGSQYTVREGHLYFVTPEGIFRSQQFSHRSNKASQNLSLSPLRRNREYMEGDSHIWFHHSDSEFMLRVRKEEDPRSTGALHVTNRFNYNEELLTLGLEENEKQELKQINTMDDVNDLFSNLSPVIRQELQTPITSISLDQELEEVVKGLLGLDNNDLPGLSNASLESLKELQELWKAQDIFLRECYGDSHPLNNLESTQEESNFRKFLIDVDLNSYNSQEPDKRTQILTKLWEETNNTRQDNRAELQRAQAQMQRFGQGYQQLSEDYSDKLNSISAQTDRDLESAQQEFNQVEYHAENQRRESIAESKEVKNEAIINATIQASESSADAARGYLEILYPRQSSETDSNTEIGAQP